MTSRPAAPESETPETDALWNDPAMEADHIWAKARSLERRLSLAQTEIKGHMRVVDELQGRIVELEKAMNEVEIRLRDGGTFPIKGLTWALINAALKSRA